MPSHLLTLLQILTLRLPIYWHCCKSWHCLSMPNHVICKSQHYHCQLTLLQVQMLPTLPINTITVTKKKKTIEHSQRWAWLKVYLLQKGFHFSHKLPCNSILSSRAKGNPSIKAFLVSKTQPRVQVTLFMKFSFQGAKKLLSKFGGLHMWWQMTLLLHLHFCFTHNKS